MALHRFIAGVASLLSVFLMTEVARTADVPPFPPPTPAIALTSHIVTAADYPPVSIRFREQGAVALKFTIGIDGTVVDCMVTRSSNYPRLDEAACNTVTRRWLYKPATANGNPVPLTTTATMIFELRRGPSRQRQAVPTNGLAEGQVAFRRGDYAAALRLWTPLAENGNGVARAGLGMLYANGHGVTEDHAQAATWYQLAALQNVAFAQVNLGLMYESGRGLPENPVKALMWFTIASEDTSDIGTTARQNQQRLRQRMAQFQADEADAMVVRCRQSLFEDCD